jgi:hypothetical protein
MKAQIVITLDGQVQVVTQEGTYELGKAAIKALLAKLEAQGLKVELSGPVEQHRHDDPGQVQQHVTTN